MKCAFKSWRQFLKVHFFLCLFNFIFCKVLEENPDVSKKILEMLLNIKIDRIEKTCSEYSLKTDFDSHGVRFDVYVKDGTGRCFDIEIQTSKVTKLAKRARYYQGLMDVDNIQSGGNYESLKESYVIFLCMGDAFGYNLPVYTFRYIALEDKAIEMGDGTVNERFLLFTINSNNVIFMYGLNI